MNFSQLLLIYDEAGGCPSHSVPRVVGARQARRRRKTAQLRHWLQHQRGPHCCLLHHAWGLNISPTFSSGYLARHTGAWNKNRRTTYNMQIDISIDHRPALLQHEPQTGGGACVF